MTGWALPGPVRGIRLEAGRPVGQRFQMKNPSPFRYFKTSPEIICLAVMLYVRFPLSLRNVEDLLHERGIDVSHETIRFWWNRFGPMFASEIRNRWVEMVYCYKSTCYGPEKVGSQSRPLRQSDNCWCSRGLVVSLTPRVKRPFVVNGSVLCSYSKIILNQGGCGGKICKFADL